MKNTLEIPDNYLERAVAENFHIVDVLDHIFAEEAKSKLKFKCNYAIIFKSRDLHSHQSKKITAELAFSQCNHPNIFLNTELAFLNLDTFFQRDQNMCFPISLFTVVFQEV